MTAVRTLTGTRVLLRASLRHDGRLLAPWVAIITLLSASGPLLYPLIFPTLSERQELAAALGANPAVGLVFGPARDLLTDDGFNVWRSLALGGFAAALACVFAVERATRGQEDSGQAELLASGVMGSGARLMTGVLMATLGALLMGAVAAPITVLCGGTWRVTGLLCATFTVTGLMFTGLAAVTGELASDRRTASTLALGTLGVLFAARGLAYSLELPEWTLWVNPLGWMSQTQPGTADRWWPLALGAGLALTLVLLAFVLQRHRDFGQGVIVPGPGPARGRIRGPWALVVRLNRGPFLTWALVALLLGAVFGYFTSSVGDILAGNEMVQAVLAAGATSQADLTAAFLVTILSLIGIILAVPGVQLMLKVRGEELEDRVEPLIATALTRRRYYLTNLLTAHLLGMALVGVAGALLGVVAQLTGAEVTVTDVLRQTAATLPATATVIAVAVLVVGARPAVSGIAAWAGVLASFGLTLLGPTFNLPGWALGISPFYHVPQVGSATATWTGLVVVGCVALVFTVAGWAGFQRRDLARS